MITFALLFLGVYSHSFRQGPYYSDGHPCDKGLVLDSLGICNCPNPLTDYGPSCSRTIVGSGISSFSYAWSQPGTLAQIQKFCKVDWGPVGNNNLLLFEISFFYLI